jgi:hypothetical protein
MTLLGWKQVSHVASDRISVHSLLFLIPQYDMSGFFVAARILLEDMILIV